MSPQVNNDAHELESIVEAYEAARQQGARVALKQFLPPTSSTAYREIATELIRVDMEYSWDCGESWTVEDYRKLAPELLADVEVLSEIAYEEYRLRIQQGEAVSPEQYSEKYGISTANWSRLMPLKNNGRSSEKAGWLDASIQEIWDDADKLCDETGSFPQVGERFLNFELERELGRGAFARVFLARQGELADRPVVLKIVAGTSLEPQHLARLQHTNIVPIYSVHRAAGFTAVCMPFFGSRTLADLLQSLDSQPTLPGSGEVFLSTLAARQDDTLAGSDSSHSQAGCTDHLTCEQPLPAQAEKLARASYVDAVTWLMLQLAEGLQHAHQRGIVHRDLKPANILLTEDGRAMLLDFNLSQDLVVHGPAALAIGGTLPYMAPEHLSAMLRGGQVDVRSDIYSLGVISYELLTGQPPFPIRRGPLQATVSQMLDDRRQAASNVRCQNPQAGPALASIVARCLAADAPERFQSADELREDLARHLAHLPLKNAPNPSLPERFSKWTKRHPRLSSAGTVAWVATILLLVSTWFGSRMWAKQAYQDFAARLPEVQSALSIPESDHQLIKEGIGEVQSALATYGVEQSANWHPPLTYRLLPAEERHQLNQHLAALAYQLAGAHQRWALREDKTSHLGEALRWNSFSESMLPATKRPRAIALQRAELLEASDHSEEAEQLREQVADLPSRGILDDYLGAIELGEQKHYTEALTKLGELCRLSPSDPVFWLLSGNCYAGLGELPMAEACYTVSANMLPDSYVPRLYRGMSRMDQREFQLALDDFQSTVELRPELAPCRLNRALALAALGQHEKAIADFTTALEKGATQTRVYFLRARSYEALGRTEEAQADRATGLRLTPRDELSWIARGIARLKSEPEAALSDFRQALQLNPSSISALKNVVHVTADRLNRPREALEALNSILTLNQQNLDALAGRAVLLARLGDRAEAQNSLRPLLKFSSSPNHLFQAACALSLTSKFEERDLQLGLTLLGRAVVQDPHLMARALTDPDLAQLRENPGFEKLQAAAGPWEGTSDAGAN